MSKKLRVFLFILWTFLVVVSSLFFSSVVTSSRKSLNDKKQFAALNSLYRCCLSFYDAKGVAPKSTKELIGYCRKNNCAIPYISNLTNGHILYCKTGDDCWEFVFLMPESYLKVARRQRMNGIYIIRILSVTNGRVKQDKWKE